MATDYVLFVHGVSTRETAQPQYANHLCDGITKYIESKSSGKPARTLKFLPLYWGSVGAPQEDALFSEYTSSPMWNQFWFPKLRGGMLLQFAGDIAVYMSRYIGGGIADKLKQDAEKMLGPLDSFNPDSEDRLHLVAHSLGTIILFDILFSARWNQEGVPGYDSVQAMRKALYGVEPNWEKGIQLGSISTMGSPLGLFSLIDVNKSDHLMLNDKGEVINTHDVTPNLQQMLEHLFKKQEQKTGTKLLPWRNFAHPGDPAASPLYPLMPSMVDGERKYIDVQDVITSARGDWFFSLFKNTLLALLHTNGAHNGYWDSTLVAQEIAKIILEAAEPIQQAQSKMTVS